MRRPAGLLASAVLSGCSLLGRAPEPGGRVILVTIDGLRWQEVFGGAEAALLTRQGGVRDVDRTRADFWRDTPEARREALLPFLWSVVAPEGQIFGNRARGSSAVVTNTRRISYPGYQEILGGFPDPAIDSNARRDNPNPNVLEWLNGRPGFEGRVAAFCTWDVFNHILSRPRSGLPLAAGREPVRDEPLTDRQAAVNLFLEDAGSPWHDSCLDAFTFHAALEHLRRHEPRALYVAFGETDEWAHAGRYDLYLEAARRTDRFIRTLWEAAQALEGYRGRTSLVLITDHGRGDGAAGWRNHNQETAGAERIWIAVMGPRTPALGERTDAEPVTQAQLAATLAALVGEDYGAGVPRSAPRIGSVAP